MRNALPNAAFLGFTGTPLIAGEERTREVFGDYVSVYDFAQSIEDGATVPLYYENRIPELQLTNETWTTSWTQLLEDAELDEDQERKVERVFAREYHLITRDDRLEKVAEDIVRALHRPGLPRQGDGDLHRQGHRGARCTTRSRRTGSAHLDRAGGVAGAPRRPRSGNVLEAEDRRHAAHRHGRGRVAGAERGRRAGAPSGLDIRPHRKRMVEEDLDEKFKDPADPLRLVFVCAMWITGFDVPSCSTIYLDKPMKNHTLMQTIARANRVFPGKESGADRRLRRRVPEPPEARSRSTPRPRRGDGDTADQGQGRAGGAPEAPAGPGHGDLRGARHRHGTYQGGDRASRRSRCSMTPVEALIATDDQKKAFLVLAATIARVYRAILPDPAAGAVAPDAVLFSVLAQKINALMPVVDISAVMGKVEELLDRSIAAEAYVMPGEDEPVPLVDLNRIDFEKLKERFAKGRKRTEAEKLRALLEIRLQAMVSRNHARADFLERFQKLIDEYNAGSKNIEAFFAELMAFAQSLDEEERRGMREGLTEEELALFDILTKPEPELTEKEKAEVKKVCKALLETAQGREAGPRLALQASGARRGAPDHRGCARPAARGVWRGALQDQMRRRLRAHLRRLFRRRGERVRGGGAVKGLRASQAIGQMLLGAGVVRVVSLALITLLVANHICRRYR